MDAQGAALFQHGCEPSSWLSHLRTSETQSGRMNPDQNVLTDSDKYHVNTCFWDPSWHDGDAALMFHHSRLIIFFTMVSPLIQSANDVHVFYLFILYAWSQMLKTRDRLTSAWPVIRCNLQHFLFYHIFWSDCPIT